jgi:deoxyhypusine synthase
MGKSDEIKDYVLKRGQKASDVVSQMEAAGFQAEGVALAAGLVKEMVEDGDCRVFLSFTSNMVASGLRGAFAKMVKEGLVDCVVTAGGSVDHDIIRTLKPYKKGNFFADDVKLHRRGVNRLGNVFIPNDRYAALEKWLRPVLSELSEQSSTWSPHALIGELGRRVKDRSSVLHQCAKRGVPVFCPGITDSAVGLQLYLFSQDRPDFVVDVVEELKAAIDFAFDAKRTGAIVLGGGISKHHTIGVNLLRGGLDYSVYVTTANPYDGSLSGAETNEGKSWGKIREDGRTVTVRGDATVVLPLVMSGVW